MSKLLGEFLQEQQEPFALEVYLVERGYRKGRYHNARRYPNCADFVKAVLSQLVMAKSDEKLKRGRGDAFTEKLKRRQDCSSGDSSTTLSTLMKLRNPFLQEKVETKRKSKWIADEDSKRLSPISVLEETDSDQDSPIHYKQGQPSTHHTQELGRPDSYDQYIINKRVLLQRKQLLIDCVRGVIEKPWKKAGSREELKKMMGAEDLPKLMRENSWKWSQDAIDESKAIHLLHCDFLAEEDERKDDFDQHKLGILVEVQDAILDEFINEILTW